jgi:hypothetical protein
MNLSIRFYLFADDGVFRIAQQLMQRLIHGRDAMPQYAGTKQKATDVILELDNGKPVRIARADGSYLTFDENGTFTVGSSRRASPRGKLTTRSNES